MSVEHNVICCKHQTCSVQWTYLSFLQFCHELCQLEKQKLQNNIEILKFKTNFNRINYKLLLFIRIFRQNLLTSRAYVFTAHLISSQWPTNNTQKASVERKNKPFNVLIYPEIVKNTTLRVFVF